MDIETFDFVMLAGALSSNPCMMGLRQLTITDPFPDLHTEAEYNVVAQQLSASNPSM